MALCDYQISKAAIQFNNLMFASEEIKINISHKY